MTINLGITRAVLMLILFSGCSGCSPSERTDAKSEAAQPQPKGVLFYERPVTLAAARKSNQLSPLVVLLERDPWAMVIGSDSPTFALYGDGTVIQRTATGCAWTRLNEEEAKQLLERLNLRALPRSYGRFQATHVTDQPDQDLLIYRGEKPVFVSVYGSLKDPEIRAKIPAEVVGAYDALSTFRSARSRTWLPENVEVMIWPFDNAVRSSRWPEAWPGISDPATMKRGDNSFSIFMPSTRLAEIRAFQKGKGESAVEIDGRKWSMSVRFPFPHEKLWMAPHPELDETNL